MKPADLSKWIAPSALALSPDGSTLVYALKRIDLASNSYPTQLWSQRLIGGTPAPAKLLTRGFSDVNPKFAEDSELLAFIRPDENKRPQLWIIPTTGGEAKQLTKLELGISDYIWLPALKGFVVAARVSDSGRYGTVTGRTPQQEPARTITSYKYRMDGLGYNIDRPQQLFYVALAELNEAPEVKAVDTTGYEFEIESAGDDSISKEFGKTVQLTFSRADHQLQDFNPKTGEVLLTASLHKTRDEDITNGLYAVPFESDSESASETDSQKDSGDRVPRELVSPSRKLAIKSAKVLPDGRVWLLASELGESGTDFVGKSTCLYQLDPESGELLQLTSHDQADFGESALVLTSLDSAPTALLQNRHRGSLELMQYSEKGGLQALITDKASVRLVSAAAEKVALVIADSLSAGEIELLELSAAEAELKSRTRITDFSEKLRSSGLIEPKELVVSGRNGTEVHGWVLVPEGEGPHPVLLNIHGGPFAQYEHALFDEAQVYAAAGYAVVMCNPRGAAGYGQDWGRSIIEGFGTIDFEDVIDFYEGALASYPQLNAESAGVMGGSYGGYLTAWIIAHDHRFKASIVERGFLDPVFFIGTSDIGSYFVEEYNGKDRKTQERQSPQEFVHQVKTPTLVLHSEQDLRCPISNAERYFLGLKRAGVESEFVVFPGENHGLSRDGQPLHRLQRFQVILDWWSRQLS